MPRAARSVVADQIRIEDEVWEQAFASRVPSRPPRTANPLAPVRAQIVRDPLSELADELYSASTSWLGRPAPERPDPEPSYPERSDPEPSDPSQPSNRPDPQRRTVRIQGRGAERNLPVSSSRERSRAPYDPVHLRPDRLAMWAVMLGLLLVLAAMLSGHS